MTDETTNEQPTCEASERDLATDVTATDREAAANEAAERARRIDPRAAGRWAARAVVGITCIALVAVGVQAAGNMAAAYRAPQPVLDVIPATPSESRLCAGPLLRTGGADGTADVIAPVAEPLLAVAGDGMQQGEVALEAGGSIASLDGTGLAGAETAQIDQDFARGFAASECSEPATVQWLVGGSTATGRTTTLTVANPGARNTSVSVRVFGPQGEVAAAGTTGIAVDAGSAVALDLAGFTPGLVSPVVQVVSDGAPIVARMQHTVVRTLVPGGIDLIDPMPAAATEMMFPGFVVAAPIGIEGAAGFEDATPALRLLAGTATTVTATTTGGDAPPSTSTVTLEPGVVTEVDLQGLAPGTYAVRLASPEPIVAAIRQTVAEQDGRLDLDWITPATAALPRSVAVAVPDGPGAVLHIANTSGSEQSFTVDGTPLTLAPGAPWSAPVTAGSHVVEGEGAAVSVTYQGAGQLASFTVSPPGPAADGITVQVG